MRIFWKILIFIPIIVQILLFIVFFSISDLLYYQYIQHVILLSIFSSFTVIICIIQNYSYSYNLALVATACHGGGAILLWVLGFFSALMLGLSKGGEEIFASLIEWTSIFCAVQIVNSALFLTTTFGYKKKYL